VASIEEYWDFTGKPNKSEGVACPQTGLTRFSEISWRLFEFQSPEMRPLHVAEGGSWQAFDALFGAGVHQQRKHVRRNSQRNPRLMYLLSRKRSAANTASCRCERGRNLRQSREGRSVFVIAIETPSTDPTLRQMLAPRDLIRKPVQATRSVRIKFFQIRHVAYLRRDPDKMAPIQAQNSD
jgi:hypothetical protein